MLYLTGVTNDYTREADGTFIKFGGRQNLERIGGWFEALDRDDEIVVETQKSLFAAQ